MCKVTLNYLTMSARVQLDLQSAFVPIANLFNRINHRSTRFVRNRIDRDAPSCSFVEQASQPAMVPPGGSKYSHLVLASRPPLESTIYLHETQHQVHDALGNAYERELGISPISQPPSLRICNPSFFVLSLWKIHLAKYQVRPKHIQLNLSGIIKGGTRRK